MVHIATLTVSRSDLWPPGTTVSVYPAGAVSAGGYDAAPRAAAITSGVVAADGSLSITNAGILARTTYVLHATVNGVQRMARARSTADAFGTSVRYKTSTTTWPATVTARRTADGTA